MGRSILSLTAASLLLSACTDAGERAAAGAFTGAALGFFGGPVGLGIGAGVGAAAGALTPEEEVPVAQGMVDGGESARLGQEL